MKPLAAAVCCVCTTGGVPQAAELEEVVVTATRRAESVMDVPYNISALTAQDLKEGRITNIGDLARQVPGMSYVDLGVRSNAINMGIIIRGLNGTAAGLNNFSPAAGDLTVSTYLNETPLFSNLKIADAERVEVLRGPQGTLYGAGSVGGTVRFIYNKPDAEAFSADIDAKFGQTADSDDLDYSVDGVVNIPIHETVAVRVSAGYEYYGGVIDSTNLMQFGSDGDPILANPADPLNSPAVFGSQEDTDDANIRYLRASLLWEPTDNISALLSYHRQEDRANDYTAQHPREPERTRTQFTTSPSDRDTDLYSLEVEAELGFATVTSSTSYTNWVLDSTTDFTNFGLNFQGFYAGYPRISEIFPIFYDESRFIQELRIASNGDGKWDWVLGFYYDDLDQDSAVLGEIPGWSDYTNLPGHPTAVAALGPGATFAQYYTTLFYPGGDFSTDITFDLTKEWQNENTAFFGELTYHITDAWQVTAGARVFWVDTTRSSLQKFNPCGPACAFLAESDASTQDEIFKVNTSYNLNDNTMAYFTWAEGFRQGGQNALPLAGPFAADPALLDYTNDTATNWEIGAKGSLMDRRVQYTAALYRVDWEDFQVQIPAPFSGIPTLVNGGDARSQGLELELKAQMTENLVLNFGYSFVEAQLTEDFTVRSGFDGRDGDDLPGVPKHSMTAALNYYQPVSFMGGSEIFYHLDMSYRSGVNTALNPSARNYVELGGFDTWNASVTWRNDNFRVGAYVHNITDEAGVTGVDISNEPIPGVFGPGTMHFIQRPRNFGITLGYSY